MMPFGHFTWGGGAWSPDALYATFTLHREPERVAVAQPAMQIGAGSEQWRPEQTHPGRLVDHVVEVGRASGCVSGTQTSSRSSCAHVAMSRSPPYQRVNCIGKYLGSCWSNEALECPPSLGAVSPPGQR